MLRLQFNNANKRRKSRICKYSRKTLKKRLLDTTAFMGVLVAAHSAAMMGFEGMSLRDSVWLSLTTITTVGYGDLSASTPMGQLSTVGLLYGAGITALAQAASYAVELMQFNRDQVYLGKRKWDMEDHVVFMNCPKRDSDTYFKRLTDAFRKSHIEGADREMIVISDDFAPNGISDDKLDAGIAFINQTPTSKDAFDKASLSKAAVAVVMIPDECDPMADSYVYDIVARVREENPTATVIAEVANEANKERVKRAGADHVIRPLRAYPEMVVRTILAPGTESVIEDMFDSEGEEVLRYDVDVNGKWGEVQARLILADVGTPVAYMSNEGEIVANQKPDFDLKGAKALFVLAREENHRSQQEVQSVMNDMQIELPEVKKLAPQRKGLRARLGF